MRYRGMGRPRLTVRTVPHLAAVTVGLTVAMLAAVPHAAAAASSSQWAHWTVPGKSGAVAVPGIEFPDGTVRTDAARFSVSSGKSTYLNAATPPGKRFGSSAGHGYLLFGARRGGAPSTTTIRFASPAPAGRWAFTLGDIDADAVRITGTGPGGRPLTAADLGWQGAFNYCAHPPLPRTCGSVSHADQPAWDPATSTLTGNVTDTVGAAGWFTPGTPVTSLTFTFSVRSGIPVGQLWIAGNWTGKPDIAVTKRAHPSVVWPGGVVWYRVTVANHGTAAEPDAEVRDDLSGVLDDARYDHDARADGGTVSYHRPLLSWEGAVPAGGERVITYSVTVDNPVRGGQRFRNFVITGGPRLFCPGGKSGCAASVVVRRVPPIGLCRALLGTVAGGRAAVAMPAREAC